MSDWPWDELGIDETDDVGAIKRAYATKLKTIDREGDVAGFQALRAGYEAACAFAAVGRAAHPLVPINIDAVAGSELDRPGAAVDSGRHSLAMNVVWQPPLGIDAVKPVAVHIAACISQASDPRTLENEIDRQILALSLDGVDEVGHALFVMLQERRIPPPLLDVLVARFGWRDFTRLRDWSLRDVNVLTSWLGSHELAQEPVPTVMSGHVRFVQRRLKAPLDWKRALILSATTFGDVRLPVHALYRFFGRARAELLMPSGTLRFVEAMETGTGQWRVSLAAWLGQGIKLTAIIGGGFVLAGLIAGEQWQDLSRWISPAKVLLLVILFSSALLRSVEFFDRLIKRDGPLYRPERWRGFVGEVIAYWLVWLLLAVLP